MNTKVEYTPPTMFFGGCGDGLLFAAEFAVDGDAITQYGTRYTMVWSPPDEAGDDVTWCTVTPWKLANPSHYYFAGLCETKIANAPVVRMMVEETSSRLFAR
jgi:hypothetical protein